VSDKQSYEHPQNKGDASPVVLGCDAQAMGSAQAKAKHRLACCGRAATAPAPTFRPYSEEYRSDPAALPERALERLYGRKSGLIA
jgi:hypothetical protein